MLSEDGIISELKNIDVLFRTLKYPEKCECDDLMAGEYCPACDGSYEEWAKHKESLER